MINEEEKDEENTSLDKRSDKRLIDKKFEK